MQLGFKEVDEKRQENRKDNFLFHRKLRRWETYLLIFYFVCMVGFTVWLGIKSISDASNLSSFLGMLGFVTFTLVLWCGTERFLDWLFNFVFSRQNTEKLPRQSERTLRKILNRMNGNIPVMLWNAVWGCLGFSMILAQVCTDGLTVEFVCTTGSRVLLIYVIGYVIFSFMHSRRDLTKKMLKQTKPFYNYGDGKTYAEYIDWSIREHLLLACKQYMLTEEFFLGYAQGDLGFTPVAIPREFIKAAEMRLAYTADSKGSTSKAVLACLLHNGKVVDFYLSRFVGNEIAMELLKKKGFEFTIRIDRVEYQ